MAEPAPQSPTFQFVDMEHEILEFWEEHQVLPETSGRTPGASSPTFSTTARRSRRALPHHGHLVASTIKDIVPRYWTMRGRHVLRRFGWDCHGLPIEHEIDKQLGHAATEAVEQLGVAGYNHACRGIVQRYVDSGATPSRASAAGSTSTTTTRPWTPGTWSRCGGCSSSCGTRGSSTRARRSCPFRRRSARRCSELRGNLNYQDVQDPAITVLFELRGRRALTSRRGPPRRGRCRRTSPCAWVRHRLRRCAAPRTVDASTSPKRACGGRYGAAGYRGTAVGLGLVGRRYEPLFPYFADERERGAFVVVPDDYVTTNAARASCIRRRRLARTTIAALKRRRHRGFRCPGDRERHVHATRSPTLPAST